MTVELDSKDIEIIKLLKEDSRTPMIVIGDKLNISKATVSRRISKMENDGILHDYSVNIDLSEVGIMKSLISIQVTGSPVSLVIDKLKTYPEIGHIYKAFGDHNLICEVYTKNVDDLYQMIQVRILQIPSISNVGVDVIVESESIDRNADIKLYEKIISGKQ